MKEFDSNFPLDENSEKILTMSANQTTEVIMDLVGLPDDLSDDVFRILMFSERPISAGLDLLGPHTKSFMRKSMTIKTACFMSNIAASIDELTESEIDTMETFMDINLMMLFQTCTFDELGVWIRCLEEVTHLEQGSITPNIILNIFRNMMDDSE